MKHKIILFFPLLTVLIILCCYVSFAYGFLFHQGIIYDTNTDHAGYGVRAIRYF
jgi:hypothetical protein